MQFHVCTLNVERGFHFLFLQTYLIYHMPLKYVLTFSYFVRSYFYLFFLDLIASTVIIPFRRVKLRDYA